MKITDYISKKIQEYPTLYKCSDYEKAKLNVLSSTFFTIGTGLKVAITDNPHEGGYIVEPKYKVCPRTGDTVRVKDKPYGLLKYKPIPKGYFESKVYFVHANSPMHTMQGADGDVYFRMAAGAAAPFLFEAKSTDAFAPYPFEKGYSIICDVFDENVFLQADWMLGALHLCERTIQYFLNMNEYEKDAYFASELKIKSELLSFDRERKAHGIEGIKQRRANCGYATKETMPDYDEIRALLNARWAAFRAKQLTFLTDFVHKFDENA